ncbi:hypothetical protein PC129_g11267 [Phytophthora cactorum]|uniref:Uncharacterized protein n=2 Tax=Phytophthora cactorum TaxID=29920 RepID=A0A8T1I0N1_9STRA|nr:hypothetical protein PC129_g11267 [Phytophthora cactorum]
MHAADSSNTLDTEVDTPSNLDMVPSAGNELVMCGSPLTASATTTTPVMSLDDQADEDLKKWYQHTVNWFRVAVQQVSDDKLTKRVFSTGAFVMSLLRTCTDNHRAEMQVLMKHNRSEIRKMEMASFTDNKSVDQTEFV